MLSKEILVYSKANFQLITFSKLKACNRNLQMLLFHFPGLILDLLLLACALLSVLRPPRHTTLLIRWQSLR